MILHDKTGGQRMIRKISAEYWICFDFDLMDTGAGKP